MNAPFGMATKFEHRHRFLILALIYLSTYTLYNVDRMNVVGALAHLNRSHRIPLDRQAFRFAALVAGMGVALWTWARAYSPIESGAGSDHSPQVLVVDGPYRYVRNPIYLGSLLLIIGFGFFQPRLGFPLLIALSVIFLYRLIAFEEVKQREQYGVRLPGVLPRCTEVAADPSPARPGRHTRTKMAPIHYAGCLSVGLRRHVNCICRNT